MHSNLTKIGKKYQQVKLSIPTDLHTDVVRHLYSSLEGRVPYGAWSRLITNLLRIWIKQRDGVVDKLPDIPEEADYATE